MGGFSIKLEGFKELEQKLAALGGKEAERIVRDSLRAAGEVTQRAIAELAPARPILPSGTALPEFALKHDIELHIATVDGKPAAIVRPGSETAYVANFVEYGHRLVKGGYSKVLPSGRHRGHGKEIGEVPAYPFIRPGFEGSVAPALEVMQAKVTKEIEELFGK